mmetsp:Transcript_19585/g.49782  ORF Transcript_19585/g.49782 Transcript_19585/m.49782 type:complete len:654 (+) Transcript_19585:458-2419(+)
MDLAVGSEGGEAAVAAVEEEKAELTRAVHEAFMASRGASVLGREEELATIASYIERRSSYKQLQTEKPSVIDGDVDGKSDDEDGGHERGVGGIKGLEVVLPLFIHCPMGGGKSALLASAASLWAAANASEEKRNRSFAHFAGAGGSDSASVRAMLLRLLHDLDRLQRGSAADAAALSLDDLVALTRTALVHACGPQPGERFGSRAPLVLFVDPLDQLSADGSAGEVVVRWLPLPLPPGLRTVLSALDGTHAAKAWHAALQKAATSSLNPSQPGALSLSTLALLPLRTEVRGELVESYLRRFNKRLDAEQLGALHGKRGAGSPLWLQTATEELRVHGLEQLYARAERDWLQGQDALHHSHKDQLAALRAELAQHSPTSVESARLLELEQLHARAERDRLQCQDALIRSHEAQLAALRAVFAQHSLTSVESARLLDVFETVGLRIRELPDDLAPLLATVLGRLADEDDTADAELGGGGGLVRNTLSLLCCARDEGHRAGISRAPRDLTSRAKHRRRWRASLEGWRGKGAARLRAVGTCLPGNARATATQCHGCRSPHRLPPPRGAASGQSPLARATRREGGRAPQARSRPARNRRRWRRWRVGRAAHTAGCVAVRSGGRCASERPRTPPLPLARAECAHRGIPPRGAARLLAANR